MKVYIYCAALYCKDCGEALKARLTSEGQADTGDSDDYPQGPYGNGGGEADCPQHCDDCNTFLKNPLTHEGVAYVQEAIAEGKQGLYTREWLRYYGL